MQHVRPAAAELSSLAAAGLPPPYKSAAQLSLATLSASLPRFGCESVGFECALSGPSPLLDVGISIAPDSSPSMRSALLAPSFSEWSTIGAFTAQWWEQEEGRRRFPFVFLELDAADFERGIILPSVFVALDWTIAELSAPTAFAERQARAGVARDAVSALELLLGHPLGAELPLLGKVFSSLPPGALVLHIAAMLARPARNVRASVVAPRQRAGSYLAELGWTAGLPNLQRQLDALAEFCDFGEPHRNIQVDFEVGERIGERIGVSLRPRAADWAGLFAGLVRHQLAEAEVCAALLRWPGVSVGRFVGRGYLLRYHLAHLKIVCAADLPWAVKAYFGVTAQPLELAAGSDSVEAGGPHPE